MFVFQQIQTLFLLMLLCSHEGPHKGPLHLLRHPLLQALAGHPRLTLDMHDEVPVIFTHDVGGHAGVVSRIRDTGWFDLKDLPLAEDLEVAGALQELHGDASPKAGKKQDRRKITHPGVGQSPASHIKGVFPLHPPRRVPKTSRSSLVTVRASPACPCTTGWSARAQPTSHTPGSPCC